MRQADELQLGGGYCVVQRPSDTPEGLQVAATTQAVLCKRSGIHWYSHSPTHLSRPRKLLARAKPSEGDEKGTSQTSRVDVSATSKLRVVAGIYLSLLRLRLQAYGVV